jgi:hypothetical protein
MLSNFKKWVQNAVDSSLTLDDAITSSNKNQHFSNKLVASNSNFVDMGGGGGSMGRDSRNLTKQTRSVSTILKPSRNSFSSYTNSDTDESTASEQWQSAAENGNYDRQAYASYNVNSNNSNGFMSKSTSALESTYASGGSSSRRVAYNNNTNSLNGNNSQRRSTAAAVVNHYQPDVNVVIAKRSSVTSANSESIVDDNTRLVRRQNHNSDESSARNEASTTPVDLSYFSEEEKSQIQSVLRRAQQDEEDYEKRYKMKDV